MSSGLVLYSSHDLTREELREVILQSGGALKPEVDEEEPGGLIDGKAHLWVSHVPCYDGVASDNEEELARLEQAKALIGGEFQTWLYIRLGREPGTQRLAVRFAYTCCQRWPCVVESEEPELFSCQDIERLFQEDGAFTGYGL
ncbi:MAG: hypothetical protein H0U76_17395 [Ktedonobacteraceae bacterium]|nr:hypothetical protein [Ktedonobacteraceae bacterium]